MFCFFYLHILGYRFLGKKLRLRANACNPKIIPIVAEIGILSTLFKLPEFKVSSSPGEFHPQALTDPDVTVSRHPALIIPSQ